jgi:hypothetical protein
LVRELERLGAVREESIAARLLQGVGLARGGPEPYQITIVATIADIKMS